MLVLAPTRRWFRAWNWRFLMSIYEDCGVSMDGKPHPAEEVARATRLASTVLDAQVDTDADRGRSDLLWCDDADAYDDSGFWGEEELHDDDDDDDIDDLLAEEAAEEAASREESDRIKALEEEEDRWYAIQEGLESRDRERRDARKRRDDQNERLYVVVLRTANGLEEYREVKLGNVPGAVRAFYEGHKPSFGTDTVHMSAHVSLGGGRQIFASQTFDQDPDECDRRFGAALDNLVADLDQQIADYKN